MENGRDWCWRQPWTYTPLQNSSSLPVLPACDITVGLVYVTSSFLPAAQTYPGKQPCREVVLKGGSQVSRSCNCVRTSTVVLQHLLYRLYSYYNENISGTCGLLNWKTWLQQLLAATLIYVYCNWWSGLRAQGTAIQEQHQHGATTASRTAERSKRRAGERGHAHTKKKSQVGVNKERSWGSSRSKLCTVLQYVMLDLAAHSNDKKPGKKSWWQVGLAEKYHNDGWPLEHCYFTTCIRLFPEKWHGFTTTMMSVSDIGVKADTISSFLWNLKL